MNTMKSRNKEVQVDGEVAMLPSEAAWAETMILQHLLPHTLSKQIHSISSNICTVSNIHVQEEGHTCYYI